MSILTHKKTSVELEVAKASLELNATTISELEARLENADKIGAELTTIKADLVKKDLELEASKISLAESEASQKDFDDKVSKKVTAELSTKGSIPAPEANSSEESFADLKAQYEALPAGEARATFRKQNSSLFQ